MKHFILVLLMLTFSLASIAKREQLKEVEPVIFNGVIYQTVPWSHENGTTQNGGFIQAVDASTGEVLWSLQVYKTKYVPSLERDIQDVFITNLKIDKNSKVLLVQEEKGLMYKVSLKDRRVIGVKLNT